MIAYRNTQYHLRYYLAHAVHKDANVMSNSNQTYYVFEAYHLTIHHLQNVIQTIPYNTSNLHDILIDSHSKQISTTSRQN